jgi:hypothetical protein
LSGAVPTPARIGCISKEYVDTVFGVLFILPLCLEDELLEDVVISCYDTDLER